MDTIEENITDPVIANMMKQYEKIVGIIKEDCANKGITFVGYGYFRNSDSISAQDSCYYGTNTDIYPYDKYRASRSFNDFLDN